MVAHPNGAITPIDSPTGLGLRDDHLAAKGFIRHVLPFATGQVFAGVPPADEPAVAAARAAHLAAIGGLEW